MTFGPDIAHRRFRIQLLIAAFAICLGCLEEVAVAQIPSARPTPASVELRRDWWFRAPGGSYGLVEINQYNHLANPPERTSRTSLLIGPWRWTFEATAPQILTTVTIPTLIALFTWGWIRTRRLNG